MQHSTHEYLSIDHSDQLKFGAQHRSPLDESRCMPTITVQYNNELSKHQNFTFFVTNQTLWYFFSLRNGKNGRKKVSVSACSIMYWVWLYITGIILCMHRTNEGWRYTVMSSLIGLAYTQKDPYNIMLSTAPLLWLAFFIMLIPKLSSKY